MDNIKPVDWGLLILRIGVGLIMAAHGAQKLFGIWGGPGIEGFAQMMKSMNFDPPVLWAWIAGIAEFGGGILLALGILPRISAASIAVTMFVAAFFVHGKAGLFASNGGFEYPLMILLVSLSIVISGGGKLSLFNKL
ncbi:MAG: DoxX family protein [Candidatus Omnitrophota bacterium]